MLHPVLNTPGARRALASRDIGTVYRLLKQHGVSQRAIGHVTGQSQSQISEIIAGRPVLQAHVLERIADGLGVDRAWLGVSHGGVSNGDTSPVSEVTDDMRRRELLAAGSWAAFGAAVFGDPERLPLPFRDVGRVGMGDVSDITHLTSTLRARARATGGYGRLVSACATDHTTLLDAPMTDAVRQALGSAVAELHTVAGYCCYDSGRLDWAQHHFTESIFIGREAGDGRLVADALRQAGLAVQHGGDPNHALKLYQVGQVANSEASGDPDRMPTLGSKLSADAAMAYADLDCSDLALSEVARARDTETNSDPFERAGIDMISARVHARLGMIDRAEAFASQAVSTFDARHRRAGSSAEITLATLYVRTGEPRGIALSERAITDVAGLRSVRARQRLTPLAAALESRPGTDARELARRARQVATTTATA
jgi:transcriptional regulator with XRE-family HTH domain